MPEAIERAQLYLDADAAWHRAGDFGAVVAALLSFWRSLEETA